MVSIFNSKRDEVDFLGLLVKSAENTHQAAILFRDALLGNKLPADFFQNIKDMESKGDQITHEIFRELDKVFITPIDREDIMELASNLDDVIDGIEATAARFDYLNIQTIDKYMQEFTEVIVKACEHLLEAFKLLSKKKYNSIKLHTVEVNSLENEGDRLMREGIREIFTNRRDPYDDFNLKELYERLEETTDVCEDVANILESVVLRYS